MKANIYIDGVDARAAFGVWVVRGGYNDLLAYPAMKEPAANDWPEHDGLEVDLKAPKLQPLTVGIDCVASGPKADVRGFVAALAVPGYRSILFPSLGRTFRLRLSDCDELRDYGPLQSFRLLFELDEPKHTDAAVWQSPGVHVIRSAYTLDGVNLADYGVFVQKGRDSLLRPAEVKRNLTREIATRDGRIYDTGLVRFNAKEIALKCCLKAASTAAMWSCRDALFGRLTAPGEHTLNYRGKDYPVFYRECTGTRLIALRPGFILYEFELNLTVIR